MISVVLACRMAYMACLAKDEATHLLSCHSNNNSNSINDTTTTTTNNTNNNNHTTNNNNWLR